MFFFIGFLLYNLLTIKLGHYTKGFLCILELIIISATIKGVRILHVEVNLSMVLC